MMMLKEEISKAEFVSIPLDEMLDVANKSQFSTHVHYVDNNGDIQERFLKFTDVILTRQLENCFSL